jgi:ATP-dependent Clp protease adaptor protein ClpS
MKEQLEESQSAVIAVEETPATERKRKTDRREQTDNRREPNYHVILWNDDDHSFDYVIQMLIELFGHSEEKAIEIAIEVDREGRGIATTCHKELAELKVDQVISYRQDWLAGKPIGPLHVTMEPAPE